MLYVFFSLARFISFSPLPPLHKYFYLPVFAHPRITIIIKKSRRGCSFPLALGYIICECAKHHEQHARTPKRESGNYTKLNRQEHSRNYLITARALAHYYYYLLSLLQAQLKTIRSTQSGCNNNHSNNYYTQPSSIQQQQPVLRPSAINSWPIVV
jgi:hypothetical protein